MSTVFTSFSYISLPSTPPVPPPQIYASSSLLLSTHTCKDSGALLVLLACMYSGLTIWDG